MGVGALCAVCKGVSNGFIPVFLHLGEWNDMGGLETTSNDYDEEATCRKNSVDVTLDTLTAALDAAIKCEREKPLMETLFDNRASVQRLHEINKILIGFVSMHNEEASTSKKAIHNMKRKIFLLQSTSNVLRKENQSIQSQNNQLQSQLVQSNEHPFDILQATNNSLHEENQDIQTQKNELQSQLAQANQHAFDTALKRKKEKCKLEQLEIKYRNLQSSYVSQQWETRTQVDLLEIANIELQQQCLKLRPKNMRMDYMRCSLMLHSKNMRIEFMWNPSEKDLIVSMHELLCFPNAGKTIVQDNLHRAFKCTAPERNAIIDLITILYTNGKLTKPDIKCTMVDYVVFAGSIVIDSPGAFSYLGEMLGAFCHMKALDADWLCTCIRKIVGGNEQCKVITHAFRAMMTLYGDAAARSLFGAQFIMESMLNSNETELLVSMHETLDFLITDKTCVQAYLHHAFACTAPKRKAMTKIIRILYSNGKLTKPDINCAMVDYRGRIVIDSPGAFCNLGEMISAFCHMKALDVEWLCNYTRRVWDENDQCKVITHTFQAMKFFYGDAALRSCFGGASEIKAFEMLLGSVEFKLIHAKYFCQAVIWRPHQDYRI